MALRFLAYTATLVLLVMSCKTAKDHQSSESSAGPQQKIDYAPVVAHWQEAARDYKKERGKQLLKEPNGDAASLDAIAFVLSSAQASDLNDIAADPALKQAAGKAADYRDAQSTDLASANGTAIPLSSGTATDSSIALVSTSETAITATNSTSTDSSIALVVGMGVTGVVVGASLGTGLAFYLTSHRAKAAAERASQHQQELAQKLSTEERAILQEELARELESQKSKWQANHELAQQELRRAQDALSQAQAELKSANADGTVVKDNLAQARQELESAQLNFAQAQAEVEKAKASAEKALALGKDQGSRIAELQQQLEAAQTAEQRLKEELEAAKGLNSDLKNGLAAAQDQLKSAGAANSAATEANVKLNEQILALSTQLDASKRINQGLTQQLAEARSSMEEANVLMDGLGGQLKEAGISGANVAQVQSNLASKIEALRQQMIGSQSDSLESLRKKVADWQGQVDAVQEESAKLNTQILDLNAKLRQANSDFERLAAKAIESSRALAAAEAKSAELTSKISEITNTLSMTEANREELKRQLASTDKELQAANGAIEEMRGKTQELDGHLTEATRRQLELNQQLSLAQKKNEEIARSNKSLTDSLEETSRSLAAADLKNQELAKKLEATQKKVALAETNFSQLQERYKALETKLTDVGLAVQEVAKLQAEADSIFKALVEAEINLNAHNSELAMLRQKYFLTMKNRWKNLGVEIDFWQKATGLEFSHTEIESGKFTVTYTVGGESLKLEFQEVTRLGRASYYRLASAEAEGVHLYSGRDVAYFRETLFREGKGHLMYLYDDIAGFDDTKGDHSLKLESDSVGAWTWKDPRTTQCILNKARLANLNDVLRTEVSEHLASAVAALDDGKITVSSLLDESGKLKANLDMLSPEKAAQLSELLGGSYEEFRGNYNTARDLDISKPMPQPRLQAKNPDWERLVEVSRETVRIRDEARAQQELVTDAKVAMSERLKAFRLTESDETPQQKFLRRLLAAEQDYLKIP